jgi:hypothetical protein
VAFRATSAATADPAWGPRQPARVHVAVAHPLPCCLLPMQVPVGCNYCCTADEETGCIHCWPAAAATNGRAGKADFCHLILSVTDPDAQIPTWGNPDVDILSIQFGSKSAQDLSFCIRIST